MSGERPGRLLEAINLPKHPLLRKALFDLVRISRRIDSLGDDSAESTIKVLNGVLQVFNPELGSGALPPVSVKVFIVMIAKLTVRSLDRVLPEHQRYGLPIIGDTAP